MPSIARFRDSVRCSRISQSQSGLFPTAMSSTPPAPVYAHLLPPSWKSQVREWLEEDTPSFDYGGYVVGEVERVAHLLGKGKETAVLAGVPFVDEIFSHLGCR